jgi:toxin YhaV
MQVNGWTLLAFTLFAQRLAALRNEVAHLRKKDPKGFVDHPTTKLLASVYDAIKQRVPVDPNAAEFRLGKTLGSAYTAWRRVKNGLPNRYRLFFRFSSRPARLVIYVWLNDEATLRKEGAKTDVYAVFKAMLERGEVPDSIAALQKAAPDLT